MRGRRGTWLALLLGAALLACAPAAPASPPDYPSSCPYLADHADETYDWNGGPDGDWTLNDGAPSNWVVPATDTKQEPNDHGDGPADPQPSFVCIDPGVTVHVNSSHD